MPPQLKSSPTLVKPCSVLNEGQILEITKGFKEMFNPTVNPVKQDMDIPHLKGGTLEPLKENDTVPNTQSQQLSTRIKTYIKNKKKRKNKNKKEF